MKIDLFLVAQGTNDLFLIRELKLDRHSRLLADVGCRVPFARQIFR